MYEPAAPFDVTTAAPGAAHDQALLSAVVLELPAAVLCALLARHGLAVLVTHAAIPGEPATTTPHPDRSGETTATTRDE